MEKYESCLKIEKYEVNEVHFIKNPNFKPTEEKVMLDLNIKKKTRFETKKMEVSLDTMIFENCEKNNYPFEMKISITGYFYAEGENPKVLEKNAIAIMYPFIRSLVSTYTANSNTATLILPIINVNKMIEDQEEN